MADINVSKTEFVVTVDATTNEVTVTQTPTTLVIQSEAYSPVSSVNAKTGAVVLTTTDIAEGTNLYYSTARFDTRLASKSTTDIAEGANLYYTTDRFDARLTTKSINVLSDVDTTTAPANGNSLIWNSATSQWIPGEGTAASTSAVNITNIQTEDDTFFVPFVRGTSGSRNLSADSSLTYNPNTNTLGTGLNFGGTATGATLVTIVQAAADGVERPVLFKLDNSVAYDQDNTITYNPSANRLSVTNLTVSGTLTGTASNATTAGSATTAGTAQNVQVTSSPTWPSTAYPMFSTQATGAIGPLTDTGLTYLPSTNTLTTTTFAGALTGNADTATTATNATNVTVTTMPTSTSVQNILFVGGTSGNQLPRASGSVYYDNTTSQIYSGYQIRSPNGFSGDLTGGVNATNNSGITFYEETVNGSNYITLQAPTTLSANYNLRLPSVVGTANQVLKTDGSGNLTWTSIDGRNLTYSGSTLNLDTALTSVNSVTAESATNLTLQGSDIVLQTVDNTGTSPSVTVASLGYRGDLNYNLSTFTDPVTVGGTSTTALPKYTIFFTAVSGTNTLTNVEIYHSENDPDLLTPLDWTALPVSAVGLAFTEDYVAGPSFGGALHGTIFPRGTKITSISPNAPATTATVTMTNNATASVTLYDQMANFSHMAYNSTNDLWAIIYGYNTGTGLFTNTVDTVEGTNGTTNYVDYSQLLATQFTATFTVNPVIRWRPRKITDLQPANATNDHLRVPFALGVGPGAVQTNRGLARDAFDAVGININNNGKLSGFTGKTGLNLTQFKSNSFFSSGTTAERCGPNFTFNSFAGDEDTATNALYLTDQDGLGQITWFAQPATSSLVSSTTTPASITVKATETHSTSTKQGAGMYLQYSPNSQTAAGRPKTFLRAENVTTELLAKTTLKLSKITTGTASSTAVLSQAAQLTWLTLDDTAATFTVPVKFPVYTRSAASAITGSVGMQIAISDSSGSSTQSDDGMMAFWATNGTPGWRYVHDNRAI